jgi:8-amino-7-oxononanoate synthase
VQLKPALAAQPADLGTMHQRDSSSAASPWNADLEKLRERHLFREMPEVSGVPGRHIRVRGRTALNFCSNNYLGLAGHPSVISAAGEYASRYGGGSTASRLIAGNCEPHRQVESFIASWKGTEAALVFGSGYQANVGVLSSLMEKEDLIVSDELNHASIIDGCRLSRAAVAIYPHFDLDCLEHELKRSGFRRKLVVTESVFSMGGDLAPLREMDSLCNRWGAVLMVDEAHATGVFGPRGQGLAAQLGVVPEIQMGTLGKAVGASGAYVAGTKDLVDLLINRARSFIYTTAPPPAALGSALAGLSVIMAEEGAARRERLRDNARRFAQLVTARLGVPCAASHIVPVVIGDSARTMEVSRLCLDNGVFAQGIRVPTVPEGTARIRFTLMSDHRAEDLERSVSVLADVLQATE